MMIVGLIPHFSKTAGKCAHITGNRHFIIIKHNNKIIPAATHIVKRLICHTAGHSTIPYYSHRRAVFALKSFGSVNAVCGGDRVTAVPCNKGVVLALGRLHITRKSVFGAQGRKPFKPPR